MVAEEIMLSLLVGYGLLKFKIVDAITTAQIRF